MARGKQLIRQWNLIKVLQAHRFGIGSNELAERLVCSKRQVQRDINVLQEAGFPISFDERDSNRRFWRLSPRFIERENLMLSVIEVLSLFLSQKLLSPLAGTHLGEGLSSAFTKIKGILPGGTLDHFSKLEDTLFVKHLPFHDYSAHNKEITILNCAIEGCRAIRVRYAPPNREEIDCIMHPYGLLLHGAGLYCVGRLIGHTDNELRTLKVSRFTGVELTRDVFERPEDFSLSEHVESAFGVFSAGRKQAVRVRFTGWAATSVREQLWHPSQAIVYDDGESLTAEYTLSDTPELKRWLLGFGRFATVLKPDALAADILDECEAMVANAEHIVK